MKRVSNWAAWALALAVSMGAVSAYDLGDVGLGIPPGTKWADLTPEQRVEVRQAIRRHVREMREQVEAYFAAAESGDKAAAATAAEAARHLWQTLPPRAKNMIEENHPGTGDLIKDLGTPGSTGGAGATATPAVTPKSGSVATTFTKSGHTVTETGDLTRPNGTTDVINKTWTRTGNTVTENGTVTGPNGKTVTSAGAWTKDGNVVTEDKTITGSNGKTTDVDKTWTKAGNTVTENGTVTGPNGKTLTSNATITRDGNTVTEDKTITGQDGKAATVDKTWVKTGNTVQENGAITGPNGKTGTNANSWTRDGNTVTHQGMWSGAGFGRRSGYADDFDIFGRHGLGGGRRR